MEVKNKPKSREKEENIKNQLPMRDILESLGTYVIYFDYLQPNNYTQPGFFEIPLLHGIEDGGMY